MAKKENFIGRTFWYPLGGWYFTPIGYNAEGYLIIKIVEGNKSWESNMSYPELKKGINNYFLEVNA